MNREQQRLENQRQGLEDWRLWGPYLAERAWGTVREDYSGDGRAWEYFSHDQARSRAFRWSEDALAGLCDLGQRLCFGLALWNGRDPILKERIFGLTNSQGNHGEEAKEHFFHVDAIPSHSWLKYLYKYPQAEYPYRKLVEENARRSKLEAPYGIMDTGVFDQSRYWDVEVRFAKAGPETVLIRVAAHNRGPDPAGLHLLPMLWFRNTWSWGDGGTARPVLDVERDDPGSWTVAARHPELGVCRLHGRTGSQAQKAGRPELLFTENETNARRLFNAPNPSPYVKDAFHDRVVHGLAGAVNPARTGTRFAAWHVGNCPPGEGFTVEMVLTREALGDPFSGFEGTMARREGEADAFFADLLLGACPEDALIFRQAVAGMIWCKQFFNYDVARWLDGDAVPAPMNRQSIRNGSWRHLKAKDVISMPSAWEYTWFAAWDLAFQCIVFSLFDIDFAKEQLELLLRENYLHPNGQIPAYEWSFDAVNPPVHAFAVLEIFRRERRLRGKGDQSFLRRCFNKLVMNFTWWLNRKNADGDNIFEGGFMGLDNISVFDRSKPLPPGFTLKQSDTTGWVAMFSLNLTVMALELAQEEAEYEDMAIQAYQQFLAIANAMNGFDGGGMSLWDEADGFFKDLIASPGGKTFRLDVYSFVGLIPLFASEVIRPEQLGRTPRFAAMLSRHEDGVYDGRKVTACPVRGNARGEHFLALVEADKLPRIMARVLDSAQFLSPHGIRSLSRLHRDKTDLGELPGGLGKAMIQYEPGESLTAIQGGNSNWRGPVWMPLNYLLLRSVSRFHRFHGQDVTVAAPGLGGTVSLDRAVEAVTGSIVDLFRRCLPGKDGRMLVPAFPDDSPFQHDPHWRDLRVFHEYFHGDTGQGLGSSHQTGWTGLVANMLAYAYGTGAKAPSPTAERHRR